MVIVLYPGRVSQNEVKEKDKTIEQLKVSTNRQRADWPNAMCTSFICCKELKTNFPYATRVRLVNVLPVQLRERARTGLSIQCAELVC